ncbi:MAG: DUF3800 domain-containing protein [Gammaproteobacteria bacterium]
MERFAVDESGYTGIDLLNRAQRFQGAAAVDISDENAARLIKEHFPKLQAAELKYGALAGRPGNRERLVNLQREILANHNCVTYVCNKRFLLVLMFLDYATEPWYFERGANFYQDGQNYAMASLLYHIGPVMMGEETFEGILAAFQKAVKEKTREALSELVERVRHSNWEGTLAEGFGPIAQASPECLRAIGTPGVSTDAAIVVLQSLISRMEVMAAGPYRVEHDRSKNLLQYNALLQRFIAHDAEIEFRQTRIASIRFPLKLSEVTQVDSKDSRAVQLADVLVGGVIKAANVLAGLRQADFDPVELMQLYRDDQIIHLMPSLDFEEEKKFREGSQAAEAIEYFSKHLHK